MAKDLNYLGVDIGASGIKIVELKNEGGRARLVTYGYSEYGEDGATDTLSDPAVKGKELTELCAKSGVSTKRAITGLPMASVFSTIFTFPEGMEKGLDEMIKSKAKKLAPIPEKDLVIDWKKLASVSTRGGSPRFGEAGEPTRGGSAPNEKMIKVAVTAASRDMINGYVQIFKASGLELTSLETEAYALVRSLLGKDRAPAIIVDIGSVKTNVLVVKDGVPVIHRTVKIGGKNISMLLAEKMKVDMKKAEEIKRNLGLSKLARPDSSEARRGGMENLLEEVTEPIVNEVKFCQSLYAEQYNQESIEKLVLTGGSAIIAGFAEMLRAERGLRVFVGDPWARVIYPDDLRPTLDKIGPGLAIAVGLAMRDILQ